MKEATTTEVRIAPPEQKPFLLNLIPYYIYDMSEYMGWDPNRKGQFGGCDEFIQSWGKPGQVPYFIYEKDKVAGFAGVHPCPDEPERSEIQEFFILRRHKRQGVGTSAACLLFDRHPGPWLVRVMDENEGACRFWSRVIDDYTGGTFQQTSQQYVSEHSGTWPMQYYRFESMSYGSTVERK